MQALLRRSRRAGAAPRCADRRAAPLEVDHFKREVRVGGRGGADADRIEADRGARHATPGRTFTREELVARAFGPDYDGLDRTVDTHVTNLRKKLERGGCRHAVATVHGVGYRLVVRCAAS